MTAEGVSRLGLWLEAARLRTLPAALAPVLVGTAAADRQIAWRAALAAVVAVAIQVGVNFANDLFDARSGVDTAERVGPRRVTAAGLVSQRAMGAAIAVAFTVAAAAGIALAASVGWELLLVGGAAFVAALAYSGGPKPYASYGLGELFVFIFFGVVATVGSTYVQDERITQLSYVTSVPIGLLATAILVANNLRDIAADGAAGKKTLAVRVGPERTRRLYQALIIVALGGTIVIAVVASSPLPLLGLIATPFAVPPTLAVLHATEPPALIAALAGTARLELIYASLLSIGLWVL